MTNGWAWSPLVIGRSSSGERVPVGHEPAEEPPGLRRDREDSGTRLPLAGPEPVVGGGRERHLGTDTQLDLSRLEQEEVEQVDVAQPGSDPNGSSGEVTIGTIARRIRGQPRSLWGSPPRRRNAFESLSSSP
jgi:hypothetical protein